MWVGGASYSRESFVAEAKKIGVSKRIAAVPKDLVLGVSKVYLISDMNDSDKQKFKEEIARRDKLARQEAKKSGGKPTRAEFGPPPRGEAVIFGWFTVGSVIYVVPPGTKIPEELAAHGVVPYEYIEGQFGSMDERGCGSLKIGGLYLISEPDMEKVKDLASGSIVEASGLHILETPMKYTGKRFRGICEIAST